MQRLTGLILLVVLATVAYGAIDERARGLNLVPWPKSVTMGQGQMALTPKSRIVATHATLVPLAGVLKRDLVLLTAGGLDLEVATGGSRAGDIVLTLDSSFGGPEAYVLEVGEQAHIRAGTYRGAAWGEVTLLQSLGLGPQGASLPRMKISDEPAVAGRFVMIDAARHHVDVDMLKQLVETMRFYKHSTMHLWLEDKVGFLADFSKLPSDYTREDLVELSRYARERGVAIAPEVDVPGHAPAMSRDYPEIFGALDSSGKRIAMSCNNIASEAFYQGMEKMYHGLREVFPDSEYWFLGFDEVNAVSLHKAPTYEEFLKTHNLGKAVLPYAANRLGGMAKAMGAQPICWWAGGWKTEQPIGRVLWVPAGAAAVKNNLPIVNYQFIGGKRALAKGPEIYARDYSDLSGKGGPQKAPKELMMGMDSASWESPGYVTVEHDQAGLPATIESLWTVGPKLPYEEHARRADAVAGRLRKVISPVEIEAQGLLSQAGGLYEEGKPFVVALRSPLAGTIRYTTDGTAPTAKSKVYTAPFKMSAADKPERKLVRLMAKSSGKDLVLVRAQLFDSKNQPVGLGITRDFWRATPVYAYDLYLAAPGQVWSEIPDLAKLAKADSGKFDDSMQILRFSRADRSFVLVVTGQMDLGEDGSYLFAPHASSVMEVEVDGKKVALSEGMAKKALRKSIKKPQDVEQEEGTAVTLAKGRHTYRLVFVGQPGTNTFDVQVVLPKGQKVGLGALNSKD